MQAHVNIPQTQSNAVANSFGTTGIDKEQGEVAIDNRPEAAAQRQLQSLVNSSAQVSQLKSYQVMANQSAIQRKRSAVPISSVQSFTNTVVQREGEDDEEEEGLQQEQMQIQASSSPVDVSSSVIGLSERAIKACTGIAMLSEEVPDAEKPMELIALEAKRKELQAEIDSIDTSYWVIAKQVEEGTASTEFTTEFAGIPQMVLDFCAESRSMHERLKSKGLILAQYSPTANKAKKLSELGNKSTVEERRAAAATPMIASPKVTRGNIREINNWVAGGWSAINRNLLGLLSSADKDLNAFIMANGDAANKWAADLDGRTAGLNEALENAPASPGTTYRQAGYKNIDVYKSKIREGDYVHSKGFFATSMLKGAEGAAGGDTWGKGAKVYSEITGVTGRNLGPYQEVLAGEKEILFKSGTTFHVTGISIKGHSVFVLLQEVMSLPENTPLKDPFTGDAVSP